MSIFTSITKFIAGFRLIDGNDLNSASSLTRGSVESGIVATGTTIADAYQLAAGISQVATAAANTGVKLANLNIGESQDVYNDGANPLVVYSANATIDGTAGATGVALANAKRCRYTRMTAANIESAQLGAVSA